MGARVGTIFVELDFDTQRWDAAGKRILNDAKMVAFDVEKNFKNLGIQSGDMFDMMRAQAINAYDGIKHSATSTAQDIVAAEKAKAARLIQIAQDQKNQILKHENARFEQLGIRSAAAIQDQKKQITDSYEYIKRSGTASAQDLVNIERAKNRKLKELDNELLGHRDQNLGALARAVLRYYAMFYVVSSGARQLGQLLMGGVQAIDQMRISAIATAAQITSMQGTTGDITQNYRMNLEYARALVPVLMQIDAQSFANLDQLQKMNQAMVGQGVILDTNNQKQIDAFTAISNSIAMLTAGANNPSQQAFTEMRALMSGQLRQGAEVARQIDAIIKRQGVYKDGLKDIVALGEKHGKTLELLEPYLRGVTEAAGDVSKTWASAEASIKTAWLILQTDIFAEFYEDITKSVKGLSVYMKENADDIVHYTKSSFDALKYGTAVATTMFITAKAAGAGFFAAIGKGFASLTMFIAGWQFGTWLMKNFEDARLAGVAFIDGLMKSFYYLEYAVKVVWAAISNAWDLTIGNIKKGFADFLTETASGLDKFNSFGPIANAQAALAGYADELRASVDANNDFAESVKKAKTDLTGNLEIHQSTIDAMVAEATATTDLAKVKEKTATPKFPARPDEDEEAQKRIKKIKEYIENLEWQLKVSKESEREQEALNAVRASGADIDSKAAERIKELTYALYDQKKAQAEANRMQQEAKKIIEDARTPFEKFLHTVGNLNKMLAGGYFNDNPGAYLSAFNKALSDMRSEAKKTAKETAEEVSEIWENTRNAMQNALKGFIADMQSGEMDSITDYMAGIGDASGEIFAAHLSQAIMEGLQDSQFVADIGKAFNDVMGTAFKAEDIAAGLLGTLSAAIGAIQSGDGGRMAGVGLGAGIGLALGGPMGMAVGASAGGMFGGLFGSSGPSAESLFMTGLRDNTKELRRNTEALHRNMMEQYPGQAAAAQLSEDLFTTVWDAINGKVKLNSTVLASMMPSSMQGIAALSAPGNRMDAYRQYLSPMSGVFPGLTPEEVGGKLKKHLDTFFDYIYEVTANSIAQITEQAMQWAETINADLDSWASRLGSGPTAFDKARTDYADKTLPYLSTINEQAQGLSAVLETITDPAQAAIIQEQIDRLWQFADSIQQIGPAIEEYFIDQRSGVMADANTVLAEYVGNMTILEQVTAGVDAKFDDLRKRMVDMGGAAEDLDDLYGQALAAARAKVIGDYVTGMEDQLFSLTATPAERILDDFRKTVEYIGAQFGDVGEYAHMLDMAEQIRDARLAALTAELDSLGYLTGMEKSLFDLTATPAEKISREFQETVDYINANFGDAAEYRKMIDVAEQIRDVRMAGLKEELEVVEDLAEQIRQITAGGYLSVMEALGRSFDPAVFMQSIGADTGLAGLFGDTSSSGLMSSFNRLGDLLERQAITAQQYNSILQQLIRSYQDAARSAEILAQRNKSAAGIISQFGAWEDSFSSGANQMERELQGAADQYQSFVQQIRDAGLLLICAPPIAPHLWEQIQAILSGEALQRVQDAIREKFEAMRQAVLDDADRYYREMTTGVSELERTLITVNERFADLKDRLYEAGGSAAELAQIDGLLAQTIAAATTAYRADIISRAGGLAFDITGDKRILEAKLIDLQRQILESDASNWDRQLELLSDQKQLLEQLYSVNTAQLQTQIDSVRSIDTTIDQLMGSMTKPESVEFFNRRYSQLFDAAMGGDAASISNLLGFISNYREFFDAYGGNMDNMTESIVADLEALRDNVSGGATLADLEAQLRGINENTNYLSGITEGLRQIILGAGGIPSFAFGGHHSGGLRLVGEGGPEFEFTGPSRIMSNSASTKMIADAVRQAMSDRGGSGNMTVVLTVDGRVLGEVVAEQASKGGELGRVLERTITRAVRKAA